jgi:hypothetical protein
VAGALSPPPVTQRRPDSLPACVSNGLVGVRVRHIPMLYAVAKVSGSEGLDPETGMEALAAGGLPGAPDRRGCP